MAISSTDPLAGPAPVVAVPKPPPPRGRLVSDIVRHRTDYLWVAPALLVMVLVIGYPFAYTIELSFYDTPPSSPNWYFNGVNNYVAAAYVWRWLYHSDYRLISGVLYESYLIDSPINFLDSTSMVMPSLIVANVWKEFPFAMIMLLAGLQTVPQQLLNAARVDGANAWNRFWHVTVPTLRGVIIITSILLFVANLNSFVLVWIMTGGGPANASQIWITQVYTLAFQSLQYGRASSYSVILFIVMLSLGYFYVRALTGGGRRREARG